MTDLGKMIVDVLDVDIAMMLYEDKVHLRSSVNENVNVGTLALKHGGGGHKHAAGYAIK
jgi:nanoRNase/pAp phosphatase (c-di-AMP/oligoRNAs hydrolase)